MEKFISYEGLPLSAGGAHTLAKKPVDEIYSQTTLFLEKFAHTDQPKEIELTFYSSQNGSYKTLPVLWNLSTILGIPSLRQWRFISGRQRFFTWKLAAEDLEKGFQMLDKYRQLPPNEYGPLTLSFLWHFHFIDPQTGEILAGQDKIPVIDSRQHNSQLYVRLGQTSSISAWFAFPFESFEEEALPYIESMVPFLPFKPSRKHWRIWRRSGKGKWTPESVKIANSLPNFD